MQPQIVTLAEKNNRKRQRMFLLAAKQKSYGKVLCGDEETLSKLQRYSIFRFNF
jgi:hypothetical protein